MTYISIVDQLKAAVQAVVKILDLDVTEIQLEHPASAEHGDFSTNVAMILAGKSKKSPREIAQNIVDELNKVSELHTIVSDIQIAGPGFINFRVSPEFLLQSMKVVRENPRETIRPTLSGVKVITEFTDPNPFKEFHIGHLYSNTVGEAISRLFEGVGAHVRRVCYQGDVGMHVAKSIWGMQKLFTDQGETLTDTDKKNSTQKAKFLGEAYAKGAQAFEDSDEAKEEMKHLNRQIFSKDPALMELYNIGRKWSLEYFEGVYRRLGTQFEDYYFESEVGPLGVEVVKKFLKKGVFEESQGAIIFPGSKYGLHDRVFINSLGLPTYEAKELGLAPKKFKDWPYDQSFIITGNEIKEYFKVLLKALSLIEPDLAAKTTHLTHGMVRLPEGKMSSRKGNVVTGEWLLDEAKQMIREILDKNRTELSETQRENISEVVSVAAIKYALLRNNIGGDIAFNFQESVSFEGNSGPYLQYTYARCKSVLRKAGESEKTEAGDVALSDFQKEETTVLRLLYQFDEVVQHAVIERSPHFVCTYLFELAQSYNSLYNNVSILKADHPNQRQFRLQLTEAVSLILKKGLHILGIQTVEEM